MFDAQYPNSKLEDFGWQIVYREDYRYVGGSSNKIYIGTIQQNRSDPSKYRALCYYGRFGTTLQNKLYGTETSYGVAKSNLEPKMREKRSKGYTYYGLWEIGQAGHTRLRAEVVEFIHTRFPIGSTIESHTTGKRGQVVLYHTDGLGVAVDGKSVVVPFDKVGGYFVI